MALSIIKEKHKKTVVAFGSNSLPLGEREDIDELAILAHESKSKRLIDYFEFLPSLGELKKKQLDPHPENVVDNKIIKGTKDGKDSNTAKKITQKGRIKRRKA